MSQARKLQYCVSVALNDLEDSNAGAVMLGTTLPVLLAVVLLSTPRLCRQWDFRIFAFALVMLVARSALQIGTSAERVKTNTSVLVVSSLRGNMYLTLGFMALFILWICDCALLCRVLAFHPASTTPRRKRIAIIAFPLAMHIPRIPLIIASIVLTVLEGYGSSRYTHIYTQLRLVESGLQLIVNCYCSGFLLRKAHQYAKADYAAHTPQASRARLRLRYLTESVLFAFVPASLAQLGTFITSVIVEFSPFNEQEATISARGYLRMLNSVFGVYFGLLAVWWSSARMRSSSSSASAAASASSPKVDQTATMQSLTKNTADMSLLEWALGPIDPEVKRPQMADLKATYNKTEGKGRSKPEYTFALQSKRSVIRTQVTTSSLTES